MLNITSEELFEYVDKTGFLQNQLEKAIRLLGVLNVAFQHPFLRDCFVLKGGTALNLFVYDMPRLSVDIDLNFVKSVDKSQMLKDRKEIAKIIPALFSDAYELTKSQDEHALLQYEFRYKTVSDSSDMLKIDINFLHRLPMIPPVQLSFEKLGQSVRFDILALEEVLAGKIITLLSRYTPRDLYDVYQTSIVKPNLDSTRLRLLLLYYGLMSRRSILDLFKVKWDNIIQSDIRRILHPLLIRGRYPFHVRR